MCAMATELDQQLRLEPFDPRQAASIAGWVETDRDLRWLAPSTPPPLTDAKVIGWQTSGRDTFVLTRDGNPESLGYGELNPMRREVNHFWLGHVIIRPDQRGQGVGRALVQALVDHAFRQLHAKEVSLIVFPDNLAAVQCYVRSGFTVVGEEYPRFGRNGHREKLLRLENKAPSK